MSTNKKEIPLHEVLPQFVDGSQPLIKYYIWNIDTKSFERKRIVVPKSLEGKERTEYIKEMVKTLTTHLKNGAYTYSSAETIQKINEAKDKENKTKNKNFTIREVFADFLAMKAKSLSTSSMKSYKGYLKNHFEKFCIKEDIYDKPLKLLTQDNVNDFYHQLWNDETISPKTHNEILTLINSVLRKYFKKGYFPQDYTEDCELKIVESEEGHHPFTLDEIEKLKKQILYVQEDKQFWLFFNFCFYTAARPGKEIRLLKIKDIEEFTVLINASSAKNNHSRRVIIPDALEDLINEHQLRTYPKEFYVFTKDQEPGPVPAGKNYFYKRNRKALEKCDLLHKDFDLYSTKHTGNIHAYLNGTDLLQLMKQNGHSTIQQTERYLRKIGAIRKLDKDALKHPKI